MNLLRNLTLFLALSLLLSVPLQAGFQSANLNLTVGKELLVDDEMIGTKSATLVCKGIFKGTGLIKSPIINITAKKFEFTGTIDCDEVCNITVQESFNEHMFKRKGRGKFVINIDPQLTFEEPKSDFTVPKIARPEIPQFEKRPVIHAYSPSKNSREIEINGSTFTIMGEWHIAMTDAIRKGDINEVKALYAKNPAMKEDKRLLGVFMLMSGLSDHISLVEEFIRLGANAQGTDDSNQLYIITAVVSKNVNFAQALIKAGANVNGQNKDKMPALTIAVFQDDVAMVTMLLKAQELNIDARDNWNRTALMQAARFGNKEIVNALLDAGAHADLTDDFKDTAADFAISNNHPEVASILRKKMTKNWNYFKRIFRDNGPAIMIGAMICGLAIKMGYDVYIDNQGQLKKQGQG